MKKIMALTVAAIMMLSLAACGVPDLVAHGVKSYERTQDANKAAAQQPPPSPSRQASIQAPKAPARNVPEVAARRRALPATRCSRSRIRGNRLERTGPKKAA